MSYEQKYKQSLERARDLMTNQNPPAFDKHLIEMVFPELRESEDERIRKALLEYFGEQCDMSDWNGIYGYEVVAWLEKQGEQTTDKIEPKFKVGDWLLSNNVNIYQVVKIRDNRYELHGQRGEIMSVHVDYAYGLRLWTIRDAKEGDVLAFDDDTIVIFKGLYNSSTFHSYCHIEDGIFDISKDDMPDWWEGKGFQPATKEQRDLLFTKMEEAGYEWDADKKELKKIEPKFKIEKGKWYICIKDLFDDYMDKAFLKGDMYISTQDESLIPSNSNVPCKVVYCPDTYFREWTIRDAKDGDVLLEEETGEPFIYNGNRAIYFSGYFLGAYCGIYNGEFNPYGNMHYWGKNSCPATKEQRDLLFKKMKEAGYEWSDEKKELKKI